MYKIDKSTLYITRLIPIYIHKGYVSPEHVPKNSLFGILLQLYWFGTVLFCLYPSNPTDSYPCLIKCLALDMTPFVFPPNKSSIWVNRHSKQKKHDGGNTDKLNTIIFRLFSHLNFRFSLSLFSSYLFLFPLLCFFFVFFFSASLLVFV